MAKHTTVIKGNNHEICEYCNKKGDLRPYGKNGEWICFTCGMKNEKETKKAFAGIANKGNLVIDAR